MNEFYFNQRTPDEISFISLEIYFRTNERLFGNRKYVQAYMF